MTIYLILTNQGIPSNIFKITTITDEITIISMAKFALLKFVICSCKKNIDEINIIIVSITLGFFKFNAEVINQKQIKIIYKIIEAVKNAS